LRIDGRRQHDIVKIEVGLLQILTQPSLLQISKGSKGIHNDGKTTWSKTREAKN